MAKKVEPHKLSLLLFALWSFCPLVQFNSQILAHRMVNKLVFNLRYLFALSSNNSDMQWFFDVTWNFKLGLSVHFRTIHSLRPLWTWNIAFYHLSSARTTIIGEVRTWRLPYETFDRIFGEHRTWLERLINRKRTKDNISSNRILGISRLLINLTIVILFRSSYLLSGGNDVIGMIINSR